MNTTFLDTFRNSMLARGIRKRNCTRIYNILSTINKYLTLPGLMCLVKDIESGNLKIRGIGKVYLGNIKSTLEYLSGVELKTLQQYLVDEYATDTDYIDEICPFLDDIKIGQMFKYQNQEYVLCGSSDIVPYDSGLKLNLLLIEKEKIPKNIVQPEGIIYSNDCIIIPVIKNDTGFYHKFSGLINPEYVTKEKTFQPEMAAIF